MLGLGPLYFMSTGAAQIGATYSADHIITFKGSHQIKVGHAGQNPVGYQPRGVDESSA